MEQSLSDFHHGRRKVTLGLALAIILCSASQICWKYATMKAPAGASGAEALLATAVQPSFWIAVALYVWQFFNWMMVLKYADLSFAQPITAGTYVVVGAAAWLLFDESLPPHRIIGIAFILAGVVCISRSPHKSSPAKIVDQTRPILEGQVSA